MIDRGEIETAYGKLYTSCENERFAGFDPFDGLNSRYFQASPLKYFAPARLAFLQIVKRSARNLRPMLAIAKGVNAKGLALFALAEISRFRVTGDDRHADNARSHLDALLRLAITESDSISWGYNFDWQSRAFYAPRGTPTIVPTAFAARAFAEAGEALGGPGYDSVAAKVRNFVTGRLNRSHDSDDGVCFSYTPIDRSIIYNASLLAAEILAGGNTDERDLARRAAEFVVSQQRPDGAWAYGPKLRHAWVDNFHTAYILLSLDRLTARIEDLDCAAAIRTGLDFWLGNFFLDDGTPKYYDRETFPVDIHSASAAIAALCELSRHDERCLPQAEKTAVWLLANMRDEAGWFYYQKRRNGTVKIPFIRWSNAWTAFALARLLETADAR